MDQEALVMDVIDAAAELIRGLDQTWPVKAAFWVKDIEQGSWRLYIASDQINDQNMGKAYEEVLLQSARIANPFLDTFRVKLIPASHPLAQAALDIHRRYPSSAATRLGTQRFGGIGVGGVYLYPPTVAATAP
jgi:hypothetical protein